MNRKHITVRGVGCWILSAIVLVILVASHARANIGTPSECAQTAMAALKVVEIESPKHRNRYEWYFIKISRYLWSRSRGDKDQFLEWYREACEVDRAPKNFRVDGDRVVSGVRA